MQSARLSVTAVASDKVKHQKLNFYINGKISNFNQVENVQFSRVDEGEDFIYSLSENMECIIEQTQTVVSVEKELKRFQKKMHGISSEEKKNGFVNCIKGTYDFIYGVTGENEIEFAKDKLFTGFIITGGELKVVSTNYNSFYRIRDGKISNIFQKTEKPTYAVDKLKDEDYSPSQGVIKEFNTDDLQKGDIYLFATTKANTRINEEIILKLYTQGDDSEETAWHIVNEAALHNITDNFIVITVSVDAFSTHGFLETVTTAVIDEPKKYVDEESVKESKSSEEEKAKEEKITQKLSEKKSKLFAAAASIFKNNNEEENMLFSKDESVIEETESAKTNKISEQNDTINEASAKKHMDMQFPGASTEYKKINVKRPRFMKRRMNIYLKRILSIVIVLVLMVGIVWGMIQLLKLIFADKEQVLEISPSPSIVATPTPTPTPSPSPTPEPTVSPTEEPVEQPYMEYTVKAGDNLSKISSNFYNGEDHVAEIVAYNDSITDASLIHVGQVIKLPILAGSNPDNTGN